MNHWENCGAAETNYTVSIYNHGRTSTFSGTFTGPGTEGGRGDGRVIEVFEVPGTAGRPQRTPAISSTYRGSGDQVFVLNPGGEILEDTTLTLELGDASADVYVIATNTGIHHADPHLERLDIRDAQAKGQRAAATEEEYEPAPRTWESQPVAERAWVTEFNNNPPLSSRSASRSGRLQAQSQGGVAEGDRFTFIDRDDDEPHRDSGDRPQGGHRRHDDHGGVGSRPGMVNALRHRREVRDPGDGGRRRGTFPPPRRRQRHLRLGHGRLRRAVGSAPLHRT